MDIALFNLFNLHTKQEMERRGLSWPNHHLYLLKASLCLYGIDCKLVGQWNFGEVHDLPASVPDAPGIQFAIEFRDGQIIDSEGVQGWASIWGPYEESVQAWRAAGNPLLETSRSPLTEAQIEISFEAARDHLLLDDLAPSVVAGVQKALLAADTALSMSGLFARARI